MTRRRAKNSAFAAVTAIVLLGLVATALASMAMMFAADARRTRAAAADAQLRQLLIAAAADVQQRLDKGQSSFDVKLAAPAEANIHLSAAAAAADNNGVRTVITVQLGPRTAAQTLRFTRDGERWKLAAVELQSP